MKKIQVSTVKQTADVQVINLNAYFIAKATRAHIVMKDVMDKCVGIVAPEDNAYLGKDPFTGEPVFENMKNVEVVAEPSALSNADIIKLYEQVLPLLNELTKAFEES